MVNYKHDCILHVEIRKVHLQIGFTYFFKQTREQEARIEITRTKMKGSNYRNTSTIIILVMFRFNSHFVLLCRDAHTARYVVRDSKKETDIISRKPASIENYQNLAIIGRRMEIFEKHIQNLKYLSVRFTNNPVYPS